MEREVGGPNEGSIHMTSSGDVEGWRQVRESAYGGQFSKVFTSGADVPTHDFKSKHGWVM